MRALHLQYYVCLIAQYFISEQVYVAITSTVLVDAK